MKNSELKELTDAELKERLDAERDNLIRLKMNHAVSPLENPLKIRYVRKDIARMNTEIRRRELQNNQ